MKSPYDMARSQKVLSDLYYDETRALLIEMRKYVTHHGVLIGECVAWNRLKELHGIGENEQYDAAWLEDYNEKSVRRPSC